MKKTITLALLFCIGTAIGQDTTGKFNVKHIETMHYGNWVYHISDSLKLIYKGKEYKASELIEMLEWFRENKPKKDTFHLSTKPIRFYRLGDYPDYSNKDSLKSTIYKGANGDYITPQQTKTELLLNGSPYISKADVEKHYKPRKRPKQ